MARDRQRAKQRRRRQSSAEARPTRKSRARDAGVDDPRIDEAAATDPVAAPDPLKNASAEVEQAKAAETGVGRPGPAEEVPLGGTSDVYEDVEAEELPDEDDDFEHADDEDPSLAAAGGGGGGEVSLTKEGSAEPEPRKSAGPRFLIFLRNCWEELKRVQWPDRRQVGQATAVVLGFVVLAGGFLGLMDALWKPVVNAII